MGLFKLWVMICILVVSGLPATAAMLREPYLQMVTPSSATILWQTDLNSANNSRVQYGTGSGNLNQTAFGAAVIPPSNAAVKNHVVTITGLNPATKYFYNVGTVTNGVQAGGTTSHFLVTSPSVGTRAPFTAWVVGDSGNASADQVAVRDAMLAVTGPTPPNLFLHLGDIAYDNGTDNEFTTNHFAIYQNILRQTPFWPTLGNHEAPSVNTALGIGPYYEAHVLPTGGEAGGVSSGTEAYYSFDYGNVHFIVLDSMDSSRAPGSPMLTWLQADLSGTAQEWVIALFHHPPYSKGSHDSDNAVDSGGRLVDMRENVLPILEAGGVDLVLGGHSHLYERSYPLAGAFGYGSSPNFITPAFGTLLANGNILNTGDGNPLGGGAYQNGTVYIVAGHGGKSIGSGSANHPVMFFSEKEFGSVLLTINGSILTVQNIRSNGAITDTFSINKTGFGTIVLRNTDTGDVGGWVMNGVTIGSTGIIAAGVPAAWVIAGVGDLNGDSTPDIVVRNTVTGDVGGWLMNGLTIASTGIIAAGVPTAWVIVGLGDLNGDGKDDIVLRNVVDGAVGAWLGNGLTLGTTGIIAGAPLEWDISGLGDLNGDGKDDVVLRNTSTGDVGVWLGNGLTLGATGVIAAGVPTAWVIAGLGDLNGDGKDDVVLRNTSNGDAGVWLGNGLTLGATGIIASAVPMSWMIADLVDLDGDGKDDIVVHNKVTGDVGGWLGNGLTLGATGIFAVGVPLKWEIQ